MKTSRPKIFQPITLIIESEVELTTLLHCVRQAPIQIKHDPLSTLSIDELEAKKHLIALLSVFED